MAEHRSRGTAIALALFFGILTAVTIAGFLIGAWRAPVASTEGEGIDVVITYLLVATAAILVIGHVVLCGFLFKYSAGGDSGYRKPSRRAQWAWGLGPVLVMSLVAEVGVLVFGTPIWADLYLSRPEDPVRVEVVGKQFEWIVRYPGEDGVYGRVELTKENYHPNDNPLALDESDPAAADDVVSRTLRLPEGRPAVIRLRTHDVIHSFFVPHFRVKQDLIPGITTRVKFTPTRTGEYELACSELCGLGHYRMKAPVLVLEPGEFDEWLSKQEGWFE